MIYVLLVIFIGFCIACLVTFMRSERPSKVMCKKHISKQIAKVLKKEQKFANAAKRAKNKGDFNLVAVHRLNESIFFKKRRELEKDLDSMM